MNLPDGNTTAPTAIVGQPNENKAVTIPIGSVIRVLGFTAVGVGSKVLIHAIGRKALNAGCIRLAVSAFRVADTVLPSRVWMSAAVFTGTWVSNYIASGWVPPLMMALLSYDAYKLGCIAYDSYEKSKTENSDPSSEQGTSEGNEIE
ncbi:uncharacterized protein LOC131437867 [Malaya genurostris]|uniref:uncharacterized protein LOC131437867 n=1 Tax=Malaya genurostris TaxID=325434 RepID=UPI0026F3A829|nr:uncharacterized protein LOC131437867 [Malaya genurostris]